MLETKLERVVRYQKAKFIMVSAANYGLATNTVAEVRSLSDGVKLCVKKGFLPFLVESDSKILDDWLKTKDGLVSWEVGRLEIIGKNSFSCVG